MDNVISFADGLKISGFGMVVVFVGLIILAFLISLLSKMSKEKRAEESPVIGIIESDNKIEEVESCINNDEELVAVIAAAIAASLGVSVSDINIKNIRRTTQNTPVWAAAGRQEQIYSKL